MRNLNHRGVILADVLTAAFILGVGLLAITGLFIQSSQALLALNRQEAAACFAEDGMERLRHGGSEGWTQANLEDAATAGSMEKYGVRFERTAELRNRTDLDPTGHLLEAEVRVSWPEKSGSRQVVLVTYFAVDTELDDLR